MAPDYRTPEEDQASTAHKDRIQAVLDQAIRDGSSCQVAMLLGESAQVVEQWVDKLWEGLREGLSDDEGDHPSLLLPDRLSAIVMLLHDRMEAETQKVMKGLADA